MNHTFTPASTRSLPPRSQGPAWRHGLRRLGLALALGAAGLAGAAPLALAPQYAGSWEEGSGAQATFLRLDNHWQGSTVLWDGQRFGVGTPIGHFGWGTGLWGLADFNAVQAAGSEYLAGGLPELPIVDAWTGLASSISFGNVRFNECHGSAWGQALMVPFFDGTASTGEDCSEADGSVAEQTNWTALFTGFLRITDPGQYWFSVLNDDGFYLRLVGADGQAGGQRDFLNPRERSELEQPLELAQGLYALELGAWNRLGAGVVDFRWRTDGDSDWSLVPAGNLLPTLPTPPTAVAEPALPALIGLALGALWLTRRRLRSAHVH